MTGTKVDKYKAFALVCFIASAAIVLTVIAITIMSWRAM